MKHATGRAGAVHALRMAPGEDVRLGLEAWARHTGVGGGAVIAAVGSLGPCALRFAGRTEPTILPDDQEVVTLSGTIGPDGAHLHATVSDPDGAVRGGHVPAGCVVRTTLEIVILEIEGVVLHRPHDPLTGSNELFPTGR
ncbi:MAG: DUF296 domain-containing protein [Flavobacteriales bacterium]|nr:DUF296 domain-containing protein [Flavobacteriales bacterium]